MDDDDHGVLNTRLELGIGLNDFVPKRNNHDEEQKKTNKHLISLDLSFPSNGEEEERQEGDSSNNMNNDPNNDDNDEGHVRKVLRLTKEQSTVLEDSFKNHTSLNTAQKNELAEKLEMKPRQVQVWYQNRRSRTKLKQTEVDCEFMKKCYENLSEENRKLKKELEELKSSISTPSTPLFVQLQKAAATTTTIAVCPSCEMKMLRSKGSCSDDMTDHETP